jgi:phosphatidate cytidylyltransferase
MKQRIIVGLTALPVVLIPVWLGGVWAALFFLLVALGGAWEFYHLMAIDGYKPNLPIGLSWVALLILAHWSATADYFPFSLVLVAGLIATLAADLKVREKPINSWMVTAIGAIYLGVTVGETLALRELTNGLWWLLFGFLVTWGNDTTAYFIGVTVGRHKLWPRISPKKTWEGTIAGWLGAALLGALVVSLTPLSQDHSIWFGLGVGFFCGILALFGDLSISSLKRQVGVKDSGTLFPGHGGMLDRMDSLLFVLPFVYQMVILAG